MDLIKKISEKTGMSQNVVINIIKLLQDGNTIPFIARYRKELTHGATDVQLRDFYDIYNYSKNLENRKQEVIKLINEKGLLNDNIKLQIINSTTLAQVEDLYRPYKDKKNTKASIAKEKGLEPLSVVLKKALLTKKEFEKEAEKYIKTNINQDLSVNSIQQAIQGAQDIISEEISDDPNLRSYIKNHYETKGILFSKPTKNFDNNGIYKIYKNYKKRIFEIPSYAYLALIRAEKEKQLLINFEKSIDDFEKYAFNEYVGENANSSKYYLLIAIKDGIKRLLLPSIEREIRTAKKKIADEIAIKVFGENLKNLLLTPPIIGKTILGFDPAYRTGCKLAVVDSTGKFLHSDVIYPTPPQNKIVQAETILIDIIKKYKVNLIVIGNGTGSRESEKFISNLIDKYKLNNLLYMIVSEAGASVYSASKIAQQEYPDLDVTIRGAISIAHRVQDSLAELTKIEPKSIGVGQYQHDVDSKLLKEKLDEKVEDTVNSVGVDVNTASYTLLQYIAGLSSSIAKKIVDYRDKNGIFLNKFQLKNVKGLGDKAYEQSIGFLRIKNGNEILDCTGIHPKDYSITYEILQKEYSLQKSELKLPLLINNVDFNKLMSKYGIGYETLEDIFKELSKPGLDPRNDIPLPSFKSEIVKINDLNIGMILDGIVRNVTDFGAFVDIGLHSDGLVHKSEISELFVSNPIEVVSLGQIVKVKIIGIDLEAEKVNLSMKGVNIIKSIESNQNTKKSNGSNYLGELKGNVKFL